jgi:hypothetical protein
LAKVEARDQGLAKARHYGCQRATSEPNAAENRRLAMAIEAYFKSGGGEAVRPFEAFLTDLPASRWRVSLMTNLGLVYRRTSLPSPAF